MKRVNIRLLPVSVYLNGWLAWSGVSQSRVHFSHVCVLHDFYHLFTYFSVILTSRKIIDKRHGRVFIIRNFTLEYFEIATFFER